MDFCYCDYDSDSYPEFYRECTYKALKKHKCSECKRTIEAGETYHKVVGKWQGDLCTYKSCKNCKDCLDFIKAHVPCFCYTFGEFLYDATDCAYRVSYELTPGFYFEFLRKMVAVKKAASKDRKLIVEEGGLRNLPIFKE